MRPRLARLYFDLVYNRLYDATTACLARYVEVQERLARLLLPAAGHHLLCVGLGTGNELAYLSRVEQHIDITGVDFSGTALRRARNKRGHVPGSLLMMDAHYLGFQDNSFDRLLAYHVTDFLDSPEAATREMLRVLKPGGRFVISYPSKGEGVGLGAGLMHHGLGSTTAGPGAKLRGAVAGVLTGLVYMPLMLRPQPPAYTRKDLEDLLCRLGAAVDAVEEDPVYRDHIATGTKTTGGTSSET